MGTHPGAGNKAVQSVPCKGLYPFDAGHELHTVVGGFWLGTGKNFLKITR